MEVFQRLRGHVVKVDYVANGVYDGKEERRAGDHFVERYVRIQRYVLLYGEIFQFRQQISGHSEQQQTVPERQRGGRSSSHRYANSHYVPQIGVFGQKRIIYKSKFFIYRSKM